MPVPKASANLDYLSKAWQHNVGFSCQRCYVQPEAKTHSVDHLPHNNFGHRVLGSDERHNVGSLDFGEGVGHVPILGASLNVFTMILMTATELSKLRADFLEWTGGFNPADISEIEVYLSTSLDITVDENAARVALRDWGSMAEQIEIGRQRE